jgi:hypothetical protein
MNYVKIEHGNVVVLRSGRLSPMLFIGQVVAPPTEKTAMVAIYHPGTNTFGTPTRKDREGIVGVLCIGMTPEVGARQAENLLSVRNAEIKRINREFEDGLWSLVENPA